MIKCDLVVIGAGASGMMAAITAARNGCKHVILLEGLSRVGKKLLITGNGRCNIANVDTDISHYHSKNLVSVQSVFEKFSLQDTKDFFNSLGIMLRREGNKLFPYSLQASSVLDALRYECERVGITIACNSRAVSLKQNGVVETDDAVYIAKSVIVACGGKAAPSTGSDGSGYALLKSIGHKIIEPRPAIVPIRTELVDIKALKGVRTECKLTLKCGADSVTYFDEVLFTEYGISGPAAMQLSRFVSVNHRNENVAAVIDFLPELDFNDVMEYLFARKDIAYDNRAENLTLGLLHKRIGQAVLKKCGLNINDDCSKYSDGQIMNICVAIKSYSVNITGVCGFDAAQTTAGGVAINEFTDKLQSKYSENIFACGEVLDCDGDCGGYNLQWAWSSGYVAGVAASERINKC